MERPGLRLVLIQAIETLAPDDRDRLHFFFGEDVPRIVRENRTTHGTLLLLETLFEREKLKENSLIDLILVFRRLNCLRAAEILQSFTRFKHKHSHENLNFIIV